MIFPESQNVSILVAIGVDQDEYRDIPEAAEGMKEDRESWKNFLLWLKERGLSGVKLFVGDKKVADSIEEALTFMDFPSQHWTRIRTNNTLERLNQKIKRRTRPIGAFPDENSALMLVCARLRHVASSDWGIKCYMNMDHLREMDAALDDTLAG